MRYAFFLGTGKTLHDIPRSQRFADTEESHELDAVEFRIDTVEQNQHTPWNEGNSEPFPHAECGAAEPSNDVDIVPEDELIFNDSVVVTKDKPVEEHDDPREKET